MIYLKIYNKIIRQKYNKYNNKIINKNRKKVLNLSKNKNNYNKKQIILQLLIVVLIMKKFKKNQHKLKFNCNKLLMMKIHQKLLIKNLIKKQMLFHLLIKM